LLFWDSIHFTIVCFFLWSYWVLEKSCHIFSFFLCICINTFIPEAKSFVENFNLLLSGNSSCNILSDQERQCSCQEEMIFLTPGLSVWLSSQAFNHRCRALGIAQAKEN
jgi:hypothetical protein